MDKPKMILFDYGQTLVNEAKFDGIKGTEAVLKYAIKNKYCLTAVEVQREADKINKELGRFEPIKPHGLQLEVPNHMFTAYLYESLGIRLSLTPEQVDKVFWDAAAPGTPTAGIQKFLGYLYQNKIRTGVISNISYAGKVLEKRINEVIPNHKFEFILATSEYMYQKPNQRIFKLALEKAELEPSEVWYIGDNYECDIVGARDVGIFPIWYLGAIKMPYTEKDNVTKMTSWGELQTWMEG